MAGPAEARPMISKRWLVAIAVMSSAVMEVLDTSVVNVSLPHIAGSLSSTVDEATWALTSYIVANAIILPITGWLSNYFGSKRLLMTVVTGFTLSSVLCGMAPSLPLLIFSECCRAPPAAACNLFPNPYCWKNFQDRNGAKPCRFGAWALWRPQCWAPHWVAGSRRTIPGAGSSISTYPSGSLA